MAAAARSYKLVIGPPFTPGAAAAAAAAAAALLDCFSRGETRERLHCNSLPWLAGWLVGWLAGWLVGWLAGWGGSQQEQLLPATAGHPIHVRFARAQDLI